MTCPFCSIVAGDLPADIVLRRPRVLAFRDLAPQAPTHVLVVPTVHVPDAAGLADTDPGLLGELVAAAVDVAQMEGLTAGYRLLTNTGPAAGQTVAHLHWHVLGGRQLGALAG